MSISNRTVVALVAVGGLLLTALNASAQFDNQWQVAGPANWNQPGNWSLGGPPDAASFQDFAVIENDREAFVTDSPTNPGGIWLGGSGGSGTLEIRNGGDLTAVTTSVNDGALLVGQGGGQGTLRVLDGGSLAAASITLAGGTNSSISLSGTAQLNSNGATTLNGLTDIVGQNADFSTANNLVFGSTSETRIDITGSSAPLIKAGGNANLNGTLEIDFGGVQPTPGTSWNLLDAANVSGSFSQVNAVNANLGDYQQFRFRSVESGASMNGSFGQLVLDQLLVLEIDRDSGGMRILNPSDSTPVSIDGYAITTSHESFNLSPVTGWSSLTDQNVSGWIEANPKTTQLAELDTNAASPLAGGGELPLGSPWQPQFTQLGDNREDVSFQYNTEEGDTISGAVVYTGVAVNDLALIVDAEGNAQLRNASGFPLDIWAYSIMSPNGQLVPGNWTSLQNNAGLSDWLEANPKPTALSELKTDGMETLNGGEAYNLGQIFSGGMQDLVLQYLLPNESVASIGRVLYGPIPDATLIGDYNADGKVDAADYVVWRKTGINGSQGYTQWRSNFGAVASGAGAGGGAAATMVPEPATSILIVFGFLIAVVTGARRPEAHRSS
jgi:hypothetical protein